MKLNCSISLLTLVIPFTCIYSRAETVAAPNADLPSRIASASVFYENLAPIGSAAQADSENRELWSAIETLQKEGPEAGIPDLDRFIARRPGSAWLPSLQANLGRYHREHGRYTRALRYW